MNGAIIFFVKTPGHSMVKTRLASTIGRKQAEEFFGQCVNTIEDLAIQISDDSQMSCTAHWAVAELDGLTDNLWNKFPGLYTGNGELGHRLYRIYSSMIRSFDYVILMGMDSPQVTLELIRDTVSCLENQTTDFVLGPAMDGGYYLFAGTKELPEFVFTNVSYSCEVTLHEFSSNLIQEGTIRYLPVLTDVDDEKDLLILLEEMKSNVTPAQQKLARWIRNFLRNRQRSEAI